LARPAVAAGVVLALLEALADFGTVQYYGVQTLTTAIYRTWYGLGNREGAAQIALVLIAIATLGVERGWRWLPAMVLGLAGLAKETNLLADVAFRRRRQLREAATGEFPLTLVAQNRLLDGGRAAVMQERPPMPKSPQRRRPHLLWRRRGLLDPVPGSDVVQQEI
jgi:hypothetical protein